MLNEKYQMLLDQYDICVNRLKRGRGGILCFTGREVYALSQTSLSEERLLAVRRLPERVGARRLQPVGLAAGAAVRARRRRAAPSRRRKPGRSR